MTIKEFINKAIEGGFEPKPQKAMSVYFNGDGWGKILIDSLFLDVKAWQAVGRVKGWGNEFEIDGRTFWSGTIQYPEISDEGGAYAEVWRYHMHKMIDALCEGKTIEEFIETL